MDASELKPILRGLLGEISDLRVNEAVLLAASKDGSTLGDLLETKKRAESETSERLSELRKQIEELA